MQNTSFTIRKILDGFGYGDAESTIAVMPDDTALIAKLDDVLHSPALLVPLSTDDSGQPVQDDGCGDGRLTAREYPHKYRAKVFGGGATMTVSTLIGLGKAMDIAHADLFSHAITRLNDRQIDFGAHTDDLVAAPNSGCGAIDKLPHILIAAVHYQQQIEGSIQDLGIDTTGLADVQQHFIDYTKKHAGQAYAGSDVLAEITGQHKIVKQLIDRHIEKAVILNTAVDHAVDQTYVYSSTNSQAEVFTVEGWRMQLLADKLYDTPEERSSAFLSELIYTLATAAVLTQGNLPVYLVASE